jgi:hypothetical protein
MNLTTVLVSVRSKISGKLGLQNAVWLRLIKQNNRNKAGLKFHRIHCKLVTEAFSLPSLPYYKTNWCCVMQSGQSENTLQKIRKNRLIVGGFFRQSAIAQV